MYYLKIYYRSCFIYSKKFYSLILHFILLSRQQTAGTCQIKTVNYIIYKQQCNKQAVFNHAAV